MTSVARMLDAKSVAVVGASERPGSVGAVTLAQLIEGGFTGRVYPVNPRHAELAGLPCLPSLRALPEPVDLAVIAVGNAQLEAQLALAADAGAGSAVIFASAYEAPLPGAPPLAERLSAIAIDAGMALCGANCMGFHNATSALCVCGYALPLDRGSGPVSLIAHSGSAFSVLLHNDRDLRFNVAVSPGQELHATAADYLRHCVGLEDTRAVGLLLEQIRDPAGFAAAMEIAHARDIPVVALKVGVAPIAKRMVMSHCGAIAGEDGAYEAFFDAHGVHRVTDLDELLDTLELLSAPRRAGPGGLAAVTDSGGERALLLDLAAGLTFPAPSEATTAALQAVLDPGLEPVNPLDAWGTDTAANDVFTTALRVLHDDPKIAATAFAVDLTGHSGDRYGPLAAGAAEHAEKPFAVLVHAPSGMNRAAAAALRARGVVVLEGTDSGLAAFRHLFAHRDYRARPPLAERTPVAAAVRSTWLAALAQERQLDDAGALAMLADWGIPVARTLTARSETEAVAAAAQLHRPVALKTAAAGVAHKSDVGGVHLGLAGADAVRSAYRAVAETLGPVVQIQEMRDDSGVEIALGVVNDRDFGPLVMVAAGGTLVEVLDDRRLGLPPLDRWRAQRLVDGLKVMPILAGVRGRPPVDIDSLCAAIVSLAELAVDLADVIDEIDVNPLLVTESGCVAVDALVRTRTPTTDAGVLTGS